LHLRRADEAANVERHVAKLLRQPLYQGAEKRRRPKLILESVA
jgi:hypothetical protein